MAKKVVASGLAARLDAKSRQLFEEKKGKEADYGTGADLPAGIEGGIAQLVDCRFGQYKSGDLEGEFFFIASGVVVSPVEIGDVTIKGLRTQIMEPVCDTPNSSGQRKTMADHVDWVINEMKKLMGTDLSEYSPDQLEEIAETLRVAKPYFRFRTWMGRATPAFPNPRVQHQWRGCCEYDPDTGEVSGDVVDETEEQEKKGATAASPAATAAKKGASKDKDVEEEADLRDFVEAAERNDPDDTECVNAQSAIKEAADALEIDIENLDTWAEAVDAIEEAKAGGDEEEAVDPEDEPKKGQSVTAKIKGQKKPVTGKILSVNTKAQTVKVKTSDGKTFDDVSWDSLS